MAKAWGRELGGAGRIRTGDPLLAKQVLCQLSYDPVALNCGKNVEAPRGRGTLSSEIYFVRSTGTHPPRPGLRRIFADFDHRTSSALAGFGGPSP